MKVDHNVTVDFHHNLEEKKTACILTVFGEKFTSQAKCSKNDQYNRSVGRLLTLKRVLKSSSLTREGRTKVWQSMREKGVRLTPAS